MLDRIAEIINSSEEFTLQTIVDIFTEILATIFGIVADIEGWE